METTENHWESEGVQNLWSGEGWSIHRRNKTSGKSRGGIVAKGLGEYIAKTMCNDANAGSNCFAYKVVSPSGEIFHLVKGVKNQDQPLKCEVRSGILTISIGVDTLAFADKVRTGFEITNAPGFAKDVVHELNHEDEVGATMLTDLFDDASDKAFDNGSAFIDHEKTKENQKANL